MAFRLNPFTGELDYYQPSTGGSSVTSLNSLTGALTIAAGTNITVTPSGGNTLTIASTGGGSGITQLTGDGSAGPGSGSQALTLATVNANVGSFTYASLTVNAKGLITAASSGAAPATSVGAVNHIQTSNGAGGFVDSGIIAVGGFITDGTINSIDAANRLLINSSNFTIFDWQNDYIYDPLGVISADFSNRALDDSTTTESLSWQLRQLYATDGSVVFDWSNPVYLDANTHLISNVVDPVSAQDADTKAARDAAIAAIPVNNLITLSMADNQAAPAPVFTTPATNNAIHIEYQITRNGQVEMGSIRIVNDGATPTMAQGNVVSTASVGVTFSVQISGGNVELDYVSTNTGFVPTMKYTKVVYV